MTPEQQARTRHVDPEQAELEGLGAEMDVRRPRLPVPVTERAEDSEIPTYYGLPALKPPPWKAWVPAYLYVGGVAGASAAIGAAASLDPELRPLARRARWVAAVGVPLGTALLVADMGRPSRFLYMLRVFRPTSVINVGSWLLSACGTSSAAALLPGRAGDAASAVAGASGLLVATYTGALLSNTAVPLWNRVRLPLPFEFAGTAAASAGALLLPWSEDPRTEQIARRLVVGGFALHLLAGTAVELEVRGTHAGEPLRSGAVGALWTVSKGLAVAAAICAVAAPGRRGRLATALLGTAAAVTARFAIHEAGKQSAQDPRAAFEPRR